MVKHKRRYGDIVMCMGESYPTSNSFRKRKACFNRAVVFQATILENGSTSLWTYCKYHKLPDSPGLRNLSIQEYLIAKLLQE